MLGKFKVVQLLVHIHVYIYCPRETFLGWTNLYVSQKTGYFLFIIPKAKTWPYTAQSVVTWDMTSGGRHQNLSPAHVTSLDQSYFFICHINNVRYNNCYPKQWLQSLLPFISELSSSDPKDDNDNFIISPEKRERDESSFINVHMLLKAIVQCTPM